MALDAGLIASVLIAWASARWYREMWHWIPAALHASSVGLPLPAEPPRPVWNLVFPFVWVVVLGVNTAFLVWQHRAASEARLLGYPAHRSSGWGVGSWFVPVVNLWMPFQSLRDCLPIGHPARRNVTYLQVVYILGSFILFPAGVVAFANAAMVGTIVFIVLIAAYFFVGFNARRMVTAVTSDHLNALSAKGW